MMLDELLKYNKVYHLINEGDKIVLALSGGVDSMVLANLFLEMKTDFVVAHCNFHLRGEESDGDELFVRKFAEHHHIQCFVKHFDTEQYAAEHGLSIEMAARDLRYAWFEELRQQLGYDKIALAHHADDQIETFFINLLRGSGLNGLKGMKPQNGYLIRPLLGITREEIRHYAATNHISWREDHTNAETLYLRNKIRNQLVPLLDDIHPDSRKSISKSIDFLSSENDLYRELLQKHLADVVVNENETQTVDKEILLNPNGAQLLFEWLRDYGFNTDQCHSIFEALNAQPGIHFESPTHHLYIERDSLQLVSRGEDNTTRILIDATCRQLTSPFELKIDSYNIDNTFIVNKSSNCAQFDKDKVTFPLILRHWRQGDRFRPIGMRGTKLLSDYFVNQHFTTLQKQRAWVLTTANDEIMWVVGHRMDDRFKITSSTKTVVELSLGADF